MIGFLAWIVPVYDQVFLPGDEPSDDRVLVGTLVERSDTRALFDYDAGQLILVLASDQGGVDNDTRRTSQLIAKKLSVLFVRQRWIPPGAVVK